MFEGIFGNKKKNPVEVVEGAEMEADTNESLAETPVPEDGPVSLDDARSERLASDQEVEEAFAQAEQDETLGDDDDEEEMPRAA